MGREWGGTASGGKPGTDSEFPANCAGNSCQSPVCAFTGKFDFLMAWVILMRTFEAPPPLSVPFRGFDPQRMTLTMRVVTGICLVLAIAVTCGFASDPRKEAKRPAPSLGVKTPGVQIPFAHLKTELEFEPPGPAAWVAFADSILIPSKAVLERVDPKTKENELGEPIGGLKQPCAALVSAVSRLWV